MYWPAFSGGQEKIRRLLRFLAGQPDVGVFCTAHFRHCVSVQHVAGSNEDSLTYMERRPNMEVAVPIFDLDVCKSGRILLEQISSLTGLHRGLLMTRSCCQDCHVHTRQVILDGMGPCHRVHVDQLRAASGLSQGSRGCVKSAVADSGARCVMPVSCRSLISRLKVVMRQVWTSGSAGAGALSPSTDSCGIAGSASIITILKKTAAGRRLANELIERGSQRSAAVTQAGGVVHCATTGLGRTAGSPAVVVRFRSRGSAVKTRRSATGASQFGVDLARQGIQGRVGTPDPPAAQGPP